MNLLCWNTCAEMISVTIVKEGHFFFEKKTQRSQGKGPASFLLPFLVEVCHEAQLSFHHIDCFGVVRGPGSLTGIKVGLATGYGLSYALKKPLYGETLFELWRVPLQERFPENFFCLLVDTYGAAFATQMYSPGGIPLGSPALHTAESLESSLLEQGLAFDEIMMVYVDSDQKKNPLKGARHIVDYSSHETSSSHWLAKKILNLSVENNFSSIEPFYLHPPAIHTFSKS